ncbi:hypothetical protein GCM10011519_27310 [Marmoricola endophyticus]|uniref:Glycosyltransferase family 1 protein n=1 Tax=Marmoricola endophyticus TaxID=2040280 RepID=A0A917BPB5_9ACTN|nr:glycosyltransferase [Marmoricola endophyticus]GGF51822.1 hypothetical protein GCM10011519_27310 [Marmoricola endophyticus]
MILVLAPDIAEPSGGIKVMYDVVDRLNDAGREAAVWHGREGFAASWFPHRTRIVHGLRRELATGDVLLVPEAGGPRHRHLTGDAKVVMLNQGHHFTFGGVDPGTRFDEPYPGWPNAVAAVATSRAIETFLRRLVPVHFPVHHVPLHVDAARFAPGPKERRVAVTTARRPWDVAALSELLRRSGALDDGWQVDLLHGLDRDAMAAALARAAVFVSTAERDGFGLPGAEAVLSGCLVVGFTGDGAREYLDPAWSVPLGDTDLVALHDAVVAACRLFDDDHDEWARRTTAGREHVARTYTAAAMSAALEDAFARLDAEGSPARQPAPALVEHFAAHAPGESAWDRSWVAWRSAARQTLDAWRTRG